MRMVDNGEAGDRIIAVAADDVSVNHISAIEELPAHFYSGLKHFFEEYKRLENKSVIVEELQNGETAKAIIKTAINDYTKTFGGVSYELSENTYRCRRQRIFINGSEKRPGTGAPA